jgi:hypothetical protein
MGSSQTKNITSITTEALAESTNNFLQGVTSETAVTQGIYVSGTGGNVKISGNKQDARVSINMNALQTAMSSQAAQQDLSSKVAQSAKALTQDLSLFNFSNSENNVSQYINSTIKLASNVSQSCAASGNTTQEIVVSNTGGNVEITGNTQKSLVDVYSNCVSDAVAQSSTLQKIQSDIDQQAEATTKGTDLVMLALVALLALCAPLLIPLFGLGAAFNQVLKIMFPIILGIGVVMLLVWQFNTTSVVTSSGYSRLIRNTDDCVAVAYKTTTEYGRAPLAVAACEDDENCEGYDYHAYDVDANTKEAQGRDKPETIFYKNFRNSPCDFVTDTADEVKIMKARTVFNQDDPLEPDSGYEVGDVWLPLGTGNKGNPQFAIFEENDWVPYYDWGVDTSVAAPTDQDKLEGWSPPRLELVENKTISWEDNDILGATPSGDIKTDYCLKPSGVPGYWNMFSRSEDGSWAKQELSIPGTKPWTPSDSGIGINYSGFKSEQKNNIYLYVAVGLLILGVVGTVVTFMPLSSSETETPSAPSRSSRPKSTNDIEMVPKSKNTREV